MKRLKKSLAVILTISMLGSLSACSNKDESLPEGMSQELYDTAVNALKIMDKYNDMDINAEEAEKRLKALYDKIDNMDLSDEPNKNEFLTESDQALSIKAEINSYIYALFCIISDKKNEFSDTYTIADELRGKLESD